MEDYKVYRKSFMGILANLAVLFSALFGLALLSGAVVFEGKGSFVGIVHLILAPVFLFSPRFIYWSYFEKEYNAGFLRLLESFALIIYFSTSAGTFYFYDVPPFRFLGYDTFAHFTVFFQLAVIFFVGCCFYRGYADLTFRQKKIIFGAGIILFLAGGIFWELFTKSADEIFKTAMFGDVNQRIDRDVIADLSANILGGASGLLFAMKKYGIWREKWKIKSF